MYGGVCSLLCLFEVLEVCGHVRKEGSLGDFFGGRRDKNELLARKTCWGKVVYDIVT